MWKRFTEATPKRNVVIAFILVISAFIVIGVDFYDEKQVGIVLKNFERILFFVAFILFGTRQK